MIRKSEKVLLEDILDRLYAAYKERRVPADSVEDFLNRYYKPERFHARGEAYAKALIASYKKELKTYGYCYISQHDSVSGKIVAYFPD